MGDRSAIRCLQLCSLLFAIPIGWCLIGCPPAAVVPDGDGGNAGGPDDGSDNGATDDPDDPSDGVGDGLPFGEITGNEVMVEATRSEDDNGGSRQRDERFTATYSLSPVNADQQEIFIDDILTIMIFGDVTGRGQLTYEESGADFDPELECPTTSYSGSVEWDAEVDGTYEYIPALGTIRLQAQAVSVSSPGYGVSFTTPGCSEFDNVSPSNYVWQGPGQGVWGFVTIVLENGHFEAHLDNPLGDDLGEADFYDISVDAASAP